MIICADDYGISPGVSAAIREVLEGGRVSAVSCMVVFADGEADLRSLSPSAAACDLGLHLTLTGCQPLAFQPRSSGLVDTNGRLCRFSTLLRRCYLGQVNPADVRRELDAQIQRFEQLLGFMPAFIDGHEHVHQLPVIRDALLTGIEVSFKAKPFIRSCAMPFGLTCKQLLQAPHSSLVAGAFAIDLPARKAVRLLDQAGLQHNRALLGYYPPHLRMDFGDVFAWYTSLSKGREDLFFCHPGYGHAILEERGGSSCNREDVLRFLLSDQFGRSIREGRINLDRLSSPAV